MIITWIGIERWMVWMLIEIYLLEFLKNLIKYQMSTKTHYIRLSRVKEIPGSNHDLLEKLVKLYSNWWWSHFFESQHMAQEMMKIRFFRMEMKMPKINQADYISFINLVTWITRQRKPKTKHTIVKTCRKMYRKVILCVSNWFFFILWMFEQSLILHIQCILVWKNLNFFFLVDKLYILYRSDYLGCHSKLWAI